MGGGGVGQRRRVGKDLATTAELEGDWAFFFSFFLLFFFGGNALDRAQRFELRMVLVS